MEKGERDQLPQGKIKVFLFEREADNQRGEGTGDVRIHE